MADIVIGLDKNDHGLLISYQNGENYPLVHGKLEFQEDGDSFVPVLTLCPIIDDSKDEESQRRLSNQLKTSIIDAIKFPMRVKWGPDEEQLLGLLVKDGKKHLVPLTKPSP